MIESEERIQEMIEAHQEIERRKAAAKKKREERVAGICVLSGLVAGGALYLYLRSADIGVDHELWWAGGLAFAVAIVLNMIARATPEQVLLTGILLKK